MSNLQLESDRIPFSVLNKEDENCLYNLLDTNFQMAIDKAYKNAPEYFLEDEYELTELLNKKKLMRPSPTENILRMNLWMAFHRAIGKRNAKIKNSQIYGGICSQAFFFNFYLARPERVAWLLCVPVDYASSMNEALMYSVRMLREMLDENHRDKETGKPNVPLMSLKVRIIDMIDKRVQGAIVQKSVNINVDAGSSHNVDSVTMPNEMERLKRRLEELKKRDRHAAKEIEAIQIDPAKPS